MSGDIGIGRPLVAGAAGGEVLLLRAPLSFWGGIDVSSGEIVDRHHPQRGERVTGRVLALPRGRGSSSSSSIIAEAARRGTGPAAILLGAPDHIIGLGAIVARELYEIELPVVVLDEASYCRLANGLWVEVDRDGRVSLRTRPDEEA